MPDTGAATVSTVLNRNGLTFGNQLIRHMEQTTIQLNNPGTSNWNVQVTMNNMAVYLPSGFVLDNRGLYPTGWAWRFNMTVLGMIRARKCPSAPRSSSLAAGTTRSD